MAMTGRLAGKVAIVTGAGSRNEGIGNGRAAAILFGREGAKVLCVDANAGAAETTVEMIAGEGGTASSFVADVTSGEQCRAMVGAAIERYGRLDILDNNVGIGSRGTVLDISEDEWDLVMAVNVKGMMLASRAAIPAMIESGEGGAIVNIASIAALRPRGLTAYGTSKGAVIALTRSMAVDHAKDGIRVNCIAPGPVYTPMVYAAGMADELRERRKNASLLKVEGTGWDIGHAALYLCSEEARYVTGVVLPVDGGVTISGPAR
ncbi:MAG: SDR family oxidoreductase [Dehalococcoidia bacterium]|nr:SDR family oxidoreductase [Dehalococcoidia bacterium]MCA9824569.1 SDR family oxidoreductase [Dehalococcoidia bacterium]